ncbi:bifunctional UDP-N-acetylglucosamine diphosphorylase/glucosamine-1-phosphate N-acetyltransferase GlmU [Pseudolactococcus insecticola]|uniref:Bifunctional protein GlmU n=1 Tax=Pseudolactococcus insecticola TaxID=2709158 RepID=A0A6A0B7U3_9LACT|nr:bifunctional UDP-N-acetylglucosamine diphosphorylase/glucosamine-1-phosphate N-acetyltransferase GlmU [Lactococcus insecticola]GFH40976.1 bifunctional protein GlmU [Lactococcus insecticola]
MSTYAIILAAGKGTRMKSDLPKVLHQVTGKPMVSHVVTATEAIQPDKTIAIVGHGATEVLGVLPEHVHYVKQEEQLGTGHAVKIAETLLKDLHGTTLVIAGDTPLIRPETLSDLITFHQNEKATATILTAIAENPTGYGRIIRQDGQVEKIVEQKDANDFEKSVQEINTGTYVFDNRALFDALNNITTDNAQGEYYLTDVIEIFKNDSKKVAAFVLDDFNESVGVNDRVALSEAEKIMRVRINHQHMVNGVTLIDPETTYIDSDVVIGADTIIEPNVVITGASDIGKNVHITSGSRIEDSKLYNNSEVRNSTVEYSVIEEGANVGPYAHLRPSSILHENVHVGNFVEIKGSSLGAGTKAGHLTYIGNATVGEGVNFGAGTITVNYDGKNKFNTEIEDYAFIGSNSTLIAPLSIGKNAITTAGSVITEDVNENDMAFGRARQVNKSGRAKNKPSYHND